MTTTIQKCLVFVKKSLVFKIHQMFIWKIVNTFLLLQCRSVSDGIAPVIWRNQSAW